MCLDEEGFAYFPILDGLFDIACVWTNDDMCEAKQIAILIAAAPLLQQALQTILDAFPNQWSWCRSTTRRPPCGDCPGCRAWRLMQQTLEDCEEGEE